MRLASPPDLAGDPVTNRAGHGGAAELVALKDDRCVYRACSTGFAEAIGCASPDDVVGRTDFELFPASVAREQMALDERVVSTGHADIGTIELPAPTRGGPGARVRHAMLLRSPVTAPDGSVRGIDLRLVGSPAPGEMRSATTVDYRTLVVEGLQGSLIFAGREVLFADANAARILGWNGPEALVDRGETGDVFGESDRSLLADAASRAFAAELPADPGALAPGRVADADAPERNRGDRTVRTGRVTVGARTRDGEPLVLHGRAVPVQWNARRATLLSFVEHERPRTAAAVAGSGSVADDSPTSPLPAPPGPASGPIDGPVPGAVSGAANDACGHARPVAPARAVETDAAGALARENARLRTAAVRFHQYARAAADFFWELDADLRFRRVSPELSRALGVPVEHLEGHTHRQLATHPSNVDERGVWPEHLERLAGNEAFRDVEFHWSVAGETRVIRYSGVPFDAPPGTFAGYRGIGRDVTAAVRQAEATAYHANHDALTGLVNRRHFEQLVHGALEGSARERRTHALCYMDLDSFKPVNDACGHQAGDELLRQLAQLFGSLVRKSDVLGRLGGDEFGVLLYDCNVAQALKLANQIRAEVEDFRFAWEDASFQVGVSIGLVLADDRWEHADALFSAADAACYLAKDEGRNRVVVYREGEGNASNRQVATHWVEEIEAALDAHRLHLACQRIEPLGRQPEGSRFELLMRLEKPDGSVVEPTAFLPSAERYGLSPALDLRAVELAIRWLQANPALESETRYVSLNLAAGSFTDEAFEQRLLERLEGSGLAPEKFCFELAETSVIANLARATAFMERVAGRGCRFAIDNFGSGLSSFGWIRKLPVDFLKIDGLLVRDVLDDAIDLTTVRAICDISRSMGKRTVGCHVESPRLLNAMRDAGADFAQGRHVGEPTLLGI